MSLELRIWERCHSVQNAADRATIVLRVGEKFVDWTDEDPPLDEVLLSVSLYWFTNCSSTCFYSYREVRTDAMHPTS